MDEKELENKELDNNAEVNTKLEQLQKALNSERTARKKAEAELANKRKSEAEEDEIKKLQTEMRNKLKNSQSGLSDAVIEDLMSTFGDKQAKFQVETKKQNIEKEILELKRNPDYMDIEEYGEQIRSFMKDKGLSAEQAYWAVAGAKKYSNSDESDVDTEIKEKRKTRANEGYVDGKPAGEEKKSTYTAKERTIAEKLNKSPEEIRERSKDKLSIGDILSMNKKYNKK